MIRSLTDLIADLPVRIARAGRTLSVNDITEDSRRATPGCLFIARPGSKADGARFVDEAVRAGAVAVLSSREISAPPAVTVLVSDDVTSTSAIIAERFFGSPSSRLRLIGVTGTNGKTTTTFLIQQLLIRAGIKCGLIGTVLTDDGARSAPSSLTTPPAIELSRLLRQMVDNGCTACAMEASSHALHQRRTHGLRFQIGVFTNLTGDHLDYHHTMSEYLSAKAILFEALPPAAQGGVAVVNGDDPASDDVLRRSAARRVRCSEHDSIADCFAHIKQQTLSHTEATFAGPWGTFDARLPLLGAHNIMNTLQALAVANAFDINGQSLRASIGTATAPPGRLEPVATGDLGFAVLVDYAHTDDALENVMRALRPVLPPHGRLRVVFGCGGDRDRTKRPRMAAVACKFGDDVIITSDNPRTEDPEAIIHDIRTGVPAERLASVICEVDRAAAINLAIARAQAGDVVLIAGKGHEDYQIVGVNKRDFDDRKVSAAAIMSRVKALNAQRNRAAGGVA